MNPALDETILPAMNLGLQDKPALVFASSAGIGRGVAQELAREGARVMLCSRSEDKLKAAQNSIAAETGNRPEIFVGDVGEPGVVERAVAATVEKFGGLWSLFNNAGGPPAGNFDQFDDSIWQGAFELTLLSYVRAIRAALPHLRAGGGGRIVNNTSASTRQAIDKLLLSNTFRLGVVGLTKTLARELGPDKILVNVVSPGRIDTDRVAQLDALWAEKQGITIAEQRARSAEKIPLGAYGNPAEFGRVVAFLCSESNTYVTGQNLLIDGGMVEAY